MTPCESESCRIRAHGQAGAHPMERSVNGATTTDVSHGSSTCVRTRSGRSAAAGVACAASAVCCGAGSVFSADASSSDDSDSSSLPRSRRDFLRLREDARVAAAALGAWQEGNAGCCQQAPRLCGIGRHATHLCVCAPPRQTGRLRRGELAARQGGACGRARRLRGSPTSVWGPRRGRRGRLPRRLAATHRQKGHHPGELGSRCLAPGPAPRAGPCSSQCAAGALPHTRSWPGQCLSARLRLYCALRRRTQTHIAKLSKLCSHGHVTHCRH
jgi:hypothetical protein